MMDHWENKLFDIFYFCLTYKYNDSFAADFASFQVLPMFFLNFDTSTNIFVFSLLQTPRGFQYRACLATLLSFFSENAPYPFLLPWSDLKFYGLLIGPFPEICTGYFL